MNTNKNKKFDIDALSQKLESIDSSLKREKNSFKEMVKNISEKDETNVTKETLYSLLDDNEKHYYLMNEEYKRLISQFSPTYIEMSEWYCGIYENAPASLVPASHWIFVRYLWRHLLRFC